MSAEQCRSQVDGWLRQLAETGSEPLYLDEDGSCYLSGDDIVVCVDVPKLSDDFFVTARLVSVGSNPDVNLLARALALNLYENETRGAAIALDPQSDELVLSYSKRIEESDAVEFSNILTNMIDAASEIQRKLAESGASQETGERETTTESGPDRDAMIRV